MLSGFNCCRADATKSVDQTAITLRNMVAEVRSVEANAPQKIVNIEAYVKKTGEDVGEDLLGALAVVDKLCAQLDTSVKALTKFLVQVEMIVPTMQPQISGVLLVLQGLDYALEGEQALGAYILNTVASASSAPPTAADITNVISAAQILVPKINSAMITAQRMRILSPSVNPTQITATLTTTLDEAQKTVNIAAAGQAALNTVMANSASTTAQNPPSNVMAMQ